MITAAVLDTVLGLLAPLFADVVGDSAAAREAARSTLASYAARDDRELRFAALSIAFSFGALESLSRAADHALPPNQVLRLRGNANALNRAVLQNETRLEKAQRRPIGKAMAAPPPVPALLDPALPDPALLDPNLSDPNLPASSATGELVDFVRAAWKAEKAAVAVAQPTVALSRQQRRFAERQAEKQRQREQAQARLAQRAAQRDTAHARCAAVSV